MHAQSYTISGKRKILSTKTNLFFHKKSSIFIAKSIHSLRPPCHSTCPLPHRILLSKRTSRLYESFPRVPAALISSANDFAFSKCPSGLEIDPFHEISACDHATGASMQTLSGFKLFTQPMDRAEVLHAPIYDPSGRRKNTRGENE